MENAPASKGYQGGFMVDLDEQGSGTGHGGSDEKSFEHTSGSAGQNLYEIHAHQGKAGRTFPALSSYWPPMEAN